MKVIGTKTSPFVRRVRIVAQLVGAPCELCDSSTDEGRAILERASPIWKIPVLETDEGCLYDSHLIIDYLIDRFGQGAVRLPGPAHRWHEANRIHVIDGALDAAINVLYFRREGIAPDAAPYLKKQVDRVASAMRWLEADLAVRQSEASTGGSVGLFEIALVTTLDWMRFREMYPVGQHPSLVSFSAPFDDLEAFSSTRPVQ
jgi:glutathione S-transferase